MDAPITPPRGLYSPGWPDRAELRSMDKLTTAAYNIRKPAIPPAFESTARRLDKLVNEWMQMRDELRRDVHVEALLKTRAKLKAQLGEYLQRQAHNSEHFDSTRLPNKKQLSAFDEDGLLSPAVYHLGISQFLDSFAVNSQRRALLGGLFAALAILKKAGARTAEVGGSFITAKPQPNDIDCRWLLGELAAADLHRMMRDAPMPGAEWDARILRLDYFGIDGKAVESFETDFLRGRTITTQDTGTFPLLFGDHPGRRPVGVVRLSLIEVLPVLPEFVPFDFARNPVHEDTVNSLRAQWPEHFGKLSIETLRARGIKVMPSLRKTVR